MAGAARDIDDVPPLTPAALLDGADHLRWRA